MAPTKKSKSVNKQYSNVNEESPDKDGGSASKTKQRKRKLSDMLGSQWSREELVRFYEAYRKYGKDWKKVAAVVRNRSVEMVEALYNMNRAYLSLPEGTASVVGLIAMMTDHYNVLEGTDSERESNDASVISQKLQKRNRGKFRHNVSKVEGNHPDLLHSQAMSSSYGCLSFLKKRRSGGSRPRAVGKRTPRFPVSYAYGRIDRGKFLSPNKQGLKSYVAADDDEVVHEVALALAEASRRAGCPHFSQTSNRRIERMRSSSVQNGQRKHAQPERAGIRSNCTKEDDCFEGSLGSREAENGYSIDASYLMDAKDVRSAEGQHKGKKLHRKKPEVEDIDNNNFDDVKEACSGTEEGLNVSSVKGKVETKVTNAKNERSSPQGPRKKSRQLFFGDESSALDALQTLADLSSMMPSSTIESESSVQFKEQKTLDIVDKPTAQAAMSANQKKEKVKTSVAKEKGHQSIIGVKVITQKSAMRGRDSGPNVIALSEAKQPAFQPGPILGKRKCKSLASKVQIPKVEVNSDPSLCELQMTEASVEEGKKSISKPKRTSNIASPPKQGKSVRLAECSSSGTEARKTGPDSSASSVQVLAVNPVNLPTKLRSRRKMRKESKSSESVGNDQPAKYAPPFHNMILDLKEKLSHCLSSQLLRRWCAFEWFYSAVDCPWFSRREFLEYLNHVGLGHVTRLTRVEWGVIRSSLGKPRRLSEQFLCEEKAKLDQYRESVRTHYTELRAGVREGLPTDLARPLSVGQHVVACHPKTREVHDGNILTVDRNRCRVQFDRPVLGVAFVMDIDCMPSNPLENMPEAWKQSITVDRFRENLNEPIFSRHGDWKPGGYMKFALIENQENLDCPSRVSSSSYLMNTLLKPGKSDTVNGVSQAKAAAGETVNAQEATCTQPCILAQIQAREADIRALSELTHALEKKETLVLELRHMNNEVQGNHKDDENSLTDLEPFQKQYATVLVQLQEANDQVSSALLYLRQRNTYQANPQSPWMNSMTSSGINGGPPCSFDHPAFLSQESGPHLVEIVESSSFKAKTMVDAAVQAMSPLKEGNYAFARIGEALDSANNLYFGADFSMSATRSSLLHDPVNGSMVVSQDVSTSCTSDPMKIVHPSGPKLNGGFKLNEAQIPSELISSCIATLLMIQTCTERQYPPAEVAQILDSAVTSLKPCCSQNIHLYGEIQRCMGIVKNQILALIPT